MRPSMNILTHAQLFGWLDSLAKEQASDRPTGCGRYAPLPPG